MRPRATRDILFSSTPCACGGGTVLPPVAPCGSGQGHRACQAINRASAAGVGRRLPPLPPWWPLPRQPASMSCGGAKKQPAPSFYPLSGPSGAARPPPPPREPPCSEVEAVNRKPAGRFVRRLPAQATPPGVVPAGSPHPAAKLCAPALVQLPLAAGPLPRGSRWRHPIVRWVAGTRGSDCAASDRHSITHALRVEVRGGFAARFFG